MENLTELQTTWGAKLIAEQLDSPSTLKIDASDMILDGFLDDTFTEYRERSAVQTSLGGSVSVEAPNCGLRYFGFVIFDSLTPEQVEISIDGVHKGTAIVSGNNQRERLFTLVEPYKFEGGELVKLITPKEKFEVVQDGPVDLGIEGRIRRQEGESYRIECVAFFKTLPPSHKLPCNFIHTHAEAIGVGSQRITWITTWDAKCNVEYWKNGDNAVNVAEGISPGANHRVILKDLIPNTSYNYKISSTDREGNSVRSEQGTFVTTPAQASIGSVGIGQVSLSVRNSGNNHYNSTPVRSGIPFPEGILTSSDQLKLIDNQGSEIPLQARPLGYWPDQSIKWVLLDFQADAAEKSEHVYTLEYGNEVSRNNFDTPLSVTENTDLLTVDTGRLNIIFDKHKFGPFARISLDGSEYISNSKIVVNGSDAKQYVSTNTSPETIEIEDSGPLHCVIRIEGSHLSNDGHRLLKSILRVHAYSGLPFVRIEHTFVNDNSNTPFTDIDSMYIDIDVSNDSQQKLELIQTHDNRSLIDGVEGNHRLDGKISSGDLDISVTDFWQQYPKSLKSHSSGIQIGLCPRIEDDLYSIGGEEEYKLYFYLKDGVYRLREGISKTHVMDVGQNLPPTTMPMAQTPIDWNCETGAFGEITSAEDGLFPDYENKVNESIKEFIETHDTSREYGMMNHGDWTFDSYKDWGNNEYDTGYVFFQQWARGGDMSLFEEACRTSIHHRDIDTCHFSADALRIGGVYRHRVGHTGDFHPGGYGLVDNALATGEFPDTGLWMDSVGSPELRAILTWGGEFTISHTWIEGFLTHHFLTGDPRSLQTARMVADRYGGHYTRNYEFTNCRNNGWHLILTMEMYKATGDKFYLNAAHIIVERTLERQTEDGGWRRMLVPAHCKCAPPRHLGNAAFMVGILLIGLKHYHQATQDPAIADSILKAAKFLSDSLWVEQSSGFQSTSCPESKVSTDNFQYGIAGIAYAWRISNDTDFADLVLAGTPKAIEAIGPHGRALSSQLRASSEVLYAIKQLG